MHKSFMLDVASVKKSTADVIEDLNKIIENKSYKIVKDNNFNKTIKLIEKLSIQNEFKLNLFKDFYNYHNNKK